MPRCPFYIIQIKHNNSENINRSSNIIDDLWKKYVKLIVARSLQPQINTFT